MKPTPLPRVIFEALLTQMKQLLRLGEFKFGPSSSEYRYYKEETMRFCYRAACDIYGALCEKGLVEKCSCGATGQGWTDCEECGGSGYKAASS